MGILMVWVLKKLKNSSTLVFFLVPEERVEEERGEEKERE